MPLFREPPRRASSRLHALCSAGIATDHCLAGTWRRPSKHVGSDCRFFNRAIRRSDEFRKGDREE